jgi:uncharacterized protein YciI
MSSQVNDPGFGRSVEKAFSSARRSLLQITLAVAVLISSVPGAAASGRLSQEPKYEMGTYYLCLLVKGTRFDARQTPQTASWGEGHIKHVLGMIDSGKAVIAGPFTDDDRILGVIVTTAASADEARSWMELDPGVKAGQFSVEVLQWYAAKNVIKKPDSPLTLTNYYFAFLKRGPKWTAVSTPETQALQAAHMANIQSMAASGKLVIAGPFTNSPPYAGVFVFKVGTLEEAKALAESDPTVKAGRLAIEIHPWSVPKGSLP